MRHQLLIIVFLLFFSQLALGDDTVKPKRVVVEHWPPWEIAFDKKQAKVSGGLAVELVTELMRRINTPMELATVPWKRALLEIERGKSDLIPMIAKSEERQQYMLFTTEIFRDPLLLAYSVDRFRSFQWKKWEELKPYKFQLVRGYVYGKDWDDALRKYRFQYSTSTNDEQSLRMLKAGRIDLTLLFLVNGTQLIADLGYTEKIRFASKPIRETVFYLGISKKSQLASRLDEINESIIAMKKDGTFKKILGELYKP